MTSVSLPEFTPGLPAGQVDAALREALTICDRARECAVLWFAEVQRRALHRRLGFASLQIYATEALGFSDNRYWQFKRLADDLDRLPMLREAVATGEVGWTKAQQVARVAGADTQAAWVARAKVTGRRELEREVRAARKRPVRAAAVQMTLGEIAAVASAGLAPAQGAGAPSFTIALRVDAVQLARFEALIESVRKARTLPAAASREEIVLAGLAALAEGGGAASAVVTGRGELPLAPAQAAALACDARVQETGGSNRAVIPPKTRLAVLARDRHRCATPACGATRFLEVHHIAPRRAGGSNRAHNLVTLCGRCHAFAHEHGERLAPAQAVAHAAGAATAG